MSQRGFHADGFVRDIACAAFDAVVDGDERGRAEGFVVVRGDAEGGSQFFVELAHVDELLGVRGKFSAVVGEQEFLVAGVPEAHELAVQQDGGENRHGVVFVGGAAKFGAAAVLFDAHHSARAADHEASGRQTVHQLGRELVFHIPHRF
jgi:hypothetical protein